MRRNDKSVLDVDNQLEDLHIEFKKRANSKADYEGIADEIQKLREEKQNILFDKAGRDDLKKRIKDMKAFIKEQPTTIT